MSRSLERLVWFGLLGGPFAFVGQFLVGYVTTEAACGRAGFGVSVDAITAVATALGATVAALAGLTSVVVWRGTRAAEGAGGAEEPPPLGRVHFLATVGMTIAPLFLAIILMSGLGAIFLPECHQS